MVNIQLKSNLKQYREAHDLTQQQLADKLNISRQAYSNYETGKRDPDLRLLAKLCKIYSITFDQLVCQDFSHNEIKESKVPYRICHREDSDDIFYLTDDEIQFVLEYRSAEWEQQHLVGYVLNHRKNKGR